MLSHGLYCTLAILDGVVIMAAMNRHAMPLFVPRPSMPLNLDLSVLASFTLLWLAVVP